MKPMPPCTCTPSEATSTPTSVDQALAMGVSSSCRASAAARSSGVSARRARSVRTPVVRQMPRAAHVRMVVNRGWVFAGPDGAALPALLGEGERLLEGALGDGDALHAHLQTRGVHHDEHMRQALADLADQLGLGALVEHDAGWRAVDAQLVLDGAGPEIIARPKRAVVVEQELGGQEQADPLYPRRGVGRARDDQVADIVG